MLIGTEFSQQISVEQHQTALHMGSGSIEVFATPAMIAFMENTAMLSIANNLNEGETTVGTFIQADHLKASVVGETLLCHSKVTAENGREITFELLVTDSKGDTVGKAIHKRFVVNKTRFIEKAKELAKKR